MMKRLKNTLSEIIGARAVANVWSGRKIRWYANPISWIWGLLLLLSLFALIVCEFVYRLFYYVAIPLLIVSMFVTIHRMNDKLDALDAAVNTKTETAIILEWVRDKIEEIETE